MKKLLTIVFLLLLAVPAKIFAQITIIDVGNLTSCSLTVNVFSHNSGGSCFDFESNPITVAACPATPCAIIIHDPYTLNPVLTMCTPGGTGPYSWSGSSMCALSSATWDFVKIGDGMGGVITVDFSSCGSSSGSLCSGAVAHVNVTGSTVSIEVGP